MTTLNEFPHPGAFLLQEDSLYQSRDNGVLASGNNLVAGTVLHQQLSAGNAVPVGTPTGNGVITVGSVGADASAGRYTLVCIAAATNSGTFQLRNPDDDLLGTVTVGGGAFTNPNVTVTVADGSIDFAVGDTFAITLSGGKFTAHIPDTNTADAILWASTNATSADTRCMVIKRRCEVDGTQLVWHSGITNAQQTAALYQLKQRGIKVR